MILLALALVLFAIGAAVARHLRVLDDRHPHPKPGYPADRYRRDP